MKDIEKLGAFFLGRETGSSPGAGGGEAVLLDSRDLTTHAVIVGMTGSGKTGLSLGLLEEAAIDGIPVLAIDPKGDLGNLLLSFPGLAAEDFLPWIDPREAERQGQGPDEFARATAERWAKGLADWGQDPQRIARFRQSADLAIYTPGSRAGIPLSLLGPLRPPSAEALADPEALGDRISGQVGSLLSLLGKPAEAARGREGVLLANLLQQAWDRGETLDLGDLVRRIQKPPLRTVGVIDLDTFYPPAERMELALEFNTLLASPEAALWLEGEPLSPPHLLWTREGRPRVSIISIAHLSDAERMFVVTRLLHELVAWMRTQPGTGSLRALLLMDEIFGFFPPSANPPSKPPMLTLLKQARAFGLGVVLATQNPVDLDYKGLANAGTWFIGRLQTERDKERLLAGLEGAAAGAGGFDRAAAGAMLSSLGKRVFLLHSVHLPAPLLFQTRWTLSYLAGPLTKVQIEKLMHTEGGRTPAAVPAAPAAASGPAASGPPVLPEEIRQRFPDPATVPAGATLVPALWGTARVFYPGTAARRDHQQPVALLAALPEPPPVPIWMEARATTAAPPQASAPPREARFAPLPGAAAQAKSYSRWQKELVDHLFQNAPLLLWECPELKEVSQPGESEAEFRGRLALRLREARDTAIEKLQQRYAPQFSRLQQRLAAAEEKLARETAQAQQQKLNTALSLGTTVLSALFGRKVLSAGNLGRAAGAVRGAGRAAQEAQDVARAGETVEGLRGQLAELQAEVEGEVVSLTGAPDPVSLVLVQKSVRPRKSDITITEVSLIWVPENS